MRITRKALDIVRAEQETENKKLQMVAGTAGTKLEQGKIDKNISFLIGKVLKEKQDYIDSATKDVAAIEFLLTSKKEFRKKYKAYVRPFLDSLQEQNSFSRERLSLYGMVEDGLSIANYNLFDLAAFFGPGKYEIPDDKKQLVLLSFAPIIDSLILFSSKYNKIPSTATLIVLGYADGTGFTPDGPLFDTLKALINKEEPTKEELNQKLSELRARELSKELTKMFNQKAAAFKNIENLRIEYIPQGKGEEYPLPYIKDYTTEDARRRIVLCYWAVLPN